MATTTAAEQEQETVNQFRYIQNTVIPFIKENADRRIGKDNYEHYKIFCINRQETDEVIIIEATEEDILIAVSIATVRGKKVLFSTTVTHKDYRKKGYGTQVLKAKIARLADKGLGVRSVIAEDNTPAMALCKKSGLAVYEVTEKIRTTGPYNAVVWVDPPKK